jgi:AraC family transcriptional regulator, melibiose operon regulatory protein
MDEFGLRVWQGSVVMMAEPHRHNELELNLVFAGSMSYLFGGHSLTVRAGQLLLFWGALPHRLIACEEGSVCGWLTLPLATFLRFGLPDNLTRRVLHGTPITKTMKEMDKALFECWLQDWQLQNQQTPNSEHQYILELELEAWLRRLAFSLTEQPVKPSKKRLESKAAQLAEFIAEHYQEPLRIEAIAEQIDLNMSYASTLFKTTFSMTILDYLTQHRIAHAQRLLVTTDKHVLEIALESGFGSSSQFYAAFVKACKQTPLAYRKRVGPS